MSRGASQHLRQIHQQQQNETQKQKQQQGWARMTRAWAAAKNKELRDELVPAENVKYIFLLLRFATKTVQVVRICKLVANL